jgi:probable HAF family extracellular repeat protein
VTLSKLSCIDFASLLLLAFGLLLPAGAIAQNYTWVNIDYPGAYMTTPTAVNDSGSVVGYYLDSQYGNTHGFLYAGGVYTTIDDPEGTTFPQGINNSGEITGAVAVSLSEDYGFTYVDGVFTTFSYPGGNGQTGGQGINNHNEIVGIYTTGGTAGFLDNNGSFSTFNYPGADDTFPHAISDSGAIAGFYTASTVPFGFVYDGSTFTSINYAGSYATFAFGINNAGVVVGYASLNDYPIYEVGFLWQAGQFTVINSNAFPQPAGINNNGQIVGVYFPSNDYHGFLATPGSGPQPLQFVPSLPCRVVDTRNPNGEFGGPAISGGTSRSFPISQGGCDIPTTAAAYSLNVTLVPIQHEPVGYLTIWPTGQNRPTVSTMNSLDGRIKANAAIVPGGTGGAVSVYVTNTTNVVLDIDGYFEPPSSQTYQFHPLTPCRVADTRKSNFPAGLGTPHLSAGVARDFPVLESSCIPANVNAVAYSFNLTAVPYPQLGDPLGYLEVWPTGYEPPHPVSTLNNLTGTYVANAAIVPAGNGGEITGYGSNDTDLVIDVDGYFSPNGAGGLSLYPTVPCRVIDTRKVGSGQPFSGTLNPPVNVMNSPCGVPGTAQGYVLNATVVPSGGLSYLTLWPDSTNQPVVSTLNAADGWITSNMAIVPNVNGKIDAYADGLTQLILDISGYFAP